MSDDAQATSASGSCVGAENRSTPITGFVACVFAASIPFGRLVSLRCRSTTLSYSPYALFKFVSVALYTFLSESTRSLSPLYPPRSHSSASLPLPRVCADLCMYTREPSEMSRRNSGKCVPHAIPFLFFFLILFPRQKHDGANYLRRELS